MGHLANGFFSDYYTLPTRSQRSGNYLAHNRSDIVRLCAH
jgi:hypothetical protein